MGRDFDSYVDLSAGQSAQEKLINASYDAGAEDWIETTHSEEYYAFRDCLNAMPILLQSDEWLNNVGRFNSFVDLGTGGGEKAQAILKVLQCREASVRVLLTDLSDPMLQFSYTEVVRVARECDTIHRVKINIMTSLERLRAAATLHPQLGLPERTLYFLLGCTFANDFENKTMASLKNAFVSGDVLVLGTEMYRLAGCGKIKTQSELLKLYQGRA